MADSASVSAQCPWCGLALDEPLGSLGRPGPTCPDCGRAAEAQQHPFYGVYDAVEYDFDDVTPSERAEATGLLVGAGVPYRWDEGYRLIVPTDREEQVDVLFGHIAPYARLEGGGGATGGGVLADSVDSVDSDSLQDQESAEALANLFDAADRLMHHPDNEDAAAELADATGVVMMAAAPFGVNEVLWSTVGQLARQIITLLDAGADGDGEDVIAAAEALRAVLRDHV